MGNCPAGPGAWVLTSAIPPADWSTDSSEIEDFRALSIAPV